MGSIDLRTQLWLLYACCWCWCWWAARRWPSPSPIPKQRLNPPRGTSDLAALVAATVPTVAALDSAASVAATAPTTEATEATVATAPTTEATRVKQPPFSPTSHIHGSETLLGIKEELHLKTYLMNSAYNYT